VIGRIDVRNFREIAPYLARLLPNATYNERDGWITFKLGPRIITIHSESFVAMTFIKNKEEAMKILKDIEEKAREAWEKRDQIDLTKPLKRTILSALDVCQYLPKTNCGDCGEKTCMHLLLSF